MKVVRKDLAHNVVELVPEVLDDLWHLYNILERGDFVGSWTYRTPDINREEFDRVGKVQKKRMRLNLQAQEVEFAPFSDRLRIHGVIRGGAQDHGAHHTFLVEPHGEPLDILKVGGWKPHHLRRIEEAEKETERPRLLVLAIEDDEALFAEVRASGVREVASLTGPSSGKQYESKDSRPQWYGEVLAKLKLSRQENQPLVIVGPGFARENFLAWGKERDPDVVKGAMTEPTAHGAILGVNEAVRRGVVARVIRESATAREFGLVDKLLAEIARDGNAAYGPAQIRASLEAGAVSELLVSETFVRERRGDDLLRLAEEVAAKVHVIAANHDAGRRLEGFGGVAALLRYKPG